MKNLVVDTRTFLAFFWSIATAGILVYVVIRHGDDKGMLNLIVGALLGLISGILGTYFSLNLNHTKDKPAGLPEGTDIAVSTDTAVTIGDDTKTITSTEGGN